MKTCPTLAALALILGAMSAFAAAAEPPAGDKGVPAAVLLWPNGAPGATGDTDEDKPALLPYLPPADKNTGAAILICPGGGFTTRCTDFEGTLVAKWLNARGVAGYVLRYRIRPLYAMKDSVADAQRALQYLRSHAAELNLSPDRIGIIGFSAGSELSAAVTLKPLPGDPNAADPLDRVPSRANFQILAYGSGALPGSGSGRGNGGNAGNGNNGGNGATGGAEATPAAAPLQVPPTFLFCTAEDTGHLRGMVDYYNGLRQARIPAEVHFFANGEHGVGVAQGDPVLGEWPTLMYNWMRGAGFLTPGPRVAVQGLVKLDGEPLARGFVVLTPVDAVGAPPAVGYVFNTGPVRGQFDIRQNQGPVPGKYKVEVRQEATRWLSNSRDPVQLKYGQMQRNGTLTDADRKAWYDYMRHRDLSPSIEGQRVYTHARPGDKDDWVVEIKAGGENHIYLDVLSK